MSLSNKRRLLLVVGVSVTLLVLAIIGVLISIKGRTEASTPPPLSSGVRTFSPAPGLAGSIMKIFPTGITILIIIVAPKRFKPDVSVEDSSVRSVPIALSPDSLCEYPHLKLGRLLNLLILLITDFYFSHRTERSFHRT